MKYIAAIGACFALFVLYALGSSFLGWKHGGGLIPTLMFLAAVGTIWVAITKPSLHGSIKSANANAPKRTPNSIESDQPLDAHWEKAIEEFNGEHRNAALYAKLFANYEGEETKAKAAYLRERTFKFKKTQDIENARGYLISQGYTITESSGPDENPNMSADALVKLARSVRASKNMP